MVSWRAALLFHVAWVCGFLGPIGFAAPFAKADTVSQVQLEMSKLVLSVDGERIDRLETEVISTRRLQCVAIKEAEKDPKAEDRKRLYSDRLNELVLKYRNLTNAYPRIPTCDEV